MIFPVTGMSCASCARNVETTLQKQPGVINASVNYANASAQVELDISGADIHSLKSAVQSVGYDLLIEEEDPVHHDEIQLEYYFQLKRKTIWSIIFTVPVVIIGMFLMNMPYASLIMLLFTTPVIGWFGRSFFVNAFRQAKVGKANMDTLVALSTGIAYLFSVFNTVFPQFWHNRGLHPHVYYEAAAVITSFILLGKVLEDRAKARTSSAIKKLMGLQPKVVTLLDDQGHEQRISVSQVKAGNRILVRPGDRIPVDGKVLSGSSFVNESTITGESMPVEKDAGKSVFAGTSNLNGSFVLIACQVGSETVLSRIIDMVRQAQGSKAPVQKTVDRIAGVFVPVVIAVSLVSFVIWVLFGGENALTYALLAMVTVLVIACPCALGLATPTAIMVGMGKGAEIGILIKDAESLEIMHKVNAVVLDKTGTLTLGKPVVTEIFWYVSGQERQTAGQVLLALETQSAHPLAEAVAVCFREQFEMPAMIDNFENITGKGLTAGYQNRKYMAGNLKLMNDHGVVIPEAVLQQIHALQKEAKSVICFAMSDKLLAIIGLADKLKDSSADAVKQITGDGIELYMLTGDNLQTAQAIASQAGINNFRANMMPSDKADFIKQLQAMRKVVAMAGDGINDSTALAQADIGIAMGKGSDIAMDVAGMTIISSDLRQIARAIRLSKYTVRTINQNLFWAFIYNLIGIPIAAGVLYPAWGFMLNPMIAAAAMAMSSVSVVSNSLRLRTKRLI